jgi:hypothetical protein
MCAVGIGSPRSFDLSLRPVAKVPVRFFFGLLTAHATQYKDVTAEETTIFTDLTLVFFE